MLDIGVWLRQDWLPQEQIERDMDLREEKQETEEQLQ